MSNQPAETLIFECLEQVHRRRVLGEHVDPEEFASRLGDAYGAFLEALEADTLLDQVLEPGTELALPRPFGEYTLLRELGRGAVGVVYEALHRKLGRHVAIKILRSGYGDDPLAKDRFLREAGACAQARHPNIVHIYEAGEAEGSCYYAMELIRGKALDTALEAGSEPLSSETVYRGLADVADALHTMHTVGIIHRDIKPSNVIMDSDGRFVLADFGLARTALSETLTRTGVALGTPLYMSPEQILGRRNEIDGRTDVYGLGVTLYQCLCKKPPFQTNDMQALIRMILQERPSPPSEVDAAVHADAERVALKCMEKEPADRYATAADLGADLRRLADGERVVGRPLSPLQRVRRHVERHPYRAAATIVGLLAMILPLLFLMLQDPSPLGPARFDAIMWPDGFVVIEGEGRFASPLEDHPLKAPGRYKVRYESAGFHSQEEILEVQAGDATPRLVRLQVVDPNDPEVMERVFAAVGLDRPSYQVVSDTRAGGELVAYATWPRGPVRLREVGQLVMRTGPAYAGGADLELREGDRVLFSIPDYDPEDMLDRIDLPDDVLATIRPGPSYSWGLVFDEDTLPEGAVTTFSLTEDPAEATLAQLSQTFGMSDAPGRGMGEDGLESRNASLIAARLYHQSGMAQAAYRAAALARKEGAKDGVELEALLIQRDALRGVAGEAAGSLGKTREYLEVVNALTRDDWDETVWTALVHDE